MNKQRFTSTQLEQHVASAGLKISGLFINGFSAQFDSSLNDFIMSSLKKGAHCFGTVGRSVCRSVDQVLSAQYLLTPSLDQYQTWCRGCPQ